MGAMSKNADGANGTTERPGDLSEQSDNPQLWSPWKFWKKGRDWHQVFCDEIPLSTSNGAVKHVLSNRDEVSWMDEGY